VRTTRPSRTQGCAAAAEETPDAMMDWGGDVEIFAYDDQAETFILEGSKG